MACVALASLMSTIELEFLQSNAARVYLPYRVRRTRAPEDSLLRSRALVDSLLTNLSSLQAGLQKGSSGGGAKGRDLEIRIRDFALKAEDAIEIRLSNFLLATDDSEYREKASQELRQTLREAAEKAEEMLKIINSTSNEVVVEPNETQPSILWSKQDFESENNNVELDGSWRHPPRLENKMVGREADYATIMGQTTYGRCYHNEVNSIWIVGMPGIGKTTLAKSVYEDPKVKELFKVRAWITIPQKYSKREMLCNLLLSIAAATEASEIIKRSTNELADQVHKHLIGRRFLIVLDNFWNSQAWEDIKPCFPYSGCESRILLTTTHFDLKSCGFLSCYVYNLPLLNPNNCWNIFCNILSRKGHLAPKFKNIRSREIVEKCNGLPQSIVAVAKRLSKCTDIQQEAKRIEKELDSIGILDHNALTFIYNQLPHHLKVCFLYFGVFPKRSEIPVNVLTRLWIAEGFVESKPEASLYLKELIDRSLVLIGKESSCGEIKSCRIHSALHSFCAVGAQKEGILCAVNTKQHLGLELNAFANSCRWLSLSTHSFDYYVLCSTNKSRSIFFFCENFELFVPFKLLRVLAFVPSPFLQRENLGNLVFLRYLHVTQWFEGLEDIVSINPNLKTLIVSHKGTNSYQGDTRLPSKIWETPQGIRHVEVSYSLSVDPPSKVRRELETLYWLSLEHCTEEVFSRILNVEKLGIICGCKQGSSTEVESGNLHNLGQLGKLETLMIAFRKGWPSGLQNLNSLPLHLNIKKLKLKRSCLEWSEINIIGKLPKLEVLKLKEASNGSDWELAEGSFLKLRFLFLEARNLVYWKINGCFSCLKHLVLKGCMCLEMIPIEFRVMNSMESIEIKNCSPSVSASANAIKVYQEGRYGCVRLAIRNADQILGVEDDDVFPE